MRKAFLKSVSYYIPKVNYSNERYLNIPNKKKDKIIKKLGINKKSRASENETAIDLAIKAAKKLKKCTYYNKIDFIIYCTQSPEYFLPSGSALIQKKLFPNKNIGSFDINQGCSGFVYSLLVAKSLIENNLANCILVITSDTYSKFIDENDYSNKSIFADGSSASIVSSDKKIKEHFFNFDCGTDGNGSENLIYPNSGIKKSKKEKKLFMNGPEILKFALERIPISFENILKSNKILKRNIDFFLFHQANKYIIEILSKKIKIDPKKIILEIDKTGNTTSSSIPIALSIFYKKNKNIIGKKIFLSGFGVGYSWASTIIKIHKQFKVY